MSNWYEDDDNPRRSQKQKNIKRRDKEQKIKKRRLIEDNFLSRKEQKDEKNWMR